MRIRVATLIVLALAVPASAQRSNTPQDPLASAKSVRCTFPNYAAVKWNGTTGEVLGGSQDFSFQIDSFDFRRNRAQLVGMGQALPHARVELARRERLEQRLLVVDQQHVFHGRRTPWCVEILLRVRVDFGDRRSTCP